MPRGAQPGERRGGRAKGTRNAKKAAEIELIEATGLTPLQYMLQVLRDHNHPHAERMDAAKSAAPYVHARLAPKPDDPKDAGDVLDDPNPDV